MSSPGLALNPNMTASMHNITDRIQKSSESNSSGSAGCSDVWRDAALVVPSILFVLYLGFQAKSNVTKLSRRKSYVMIAYYALLWFSAALNLTWSFLQGWQCVPEKTMAWNFLSLFSECGMLYLEISLMAFLLQENYSSGLEALTHTFMISGSFVAFDVLVQAIFVFGFEVPLFSNVDTSHWGKWSVLFVHSLVLTAIYSYILFVRYSRWRGSLPPRPSFYNYVVIMFVTDVIGLFAYGIIGIGFGSGLWLYNLIVICRHALYLPFLYVTFLADFFQEEDWLLDSAYYSEMKDAGFFDTEWD